MLYYTGEKRPAGWGNMFNTWEAHQLIGALLYMYNTYTWEKHSAGWGICSILGRSIPNMMRHMFFTGEKHPAG